MALDLDALETSFDLVAPRGDELVDTFYTRLFDAAPAVKPLFAGTDVAGDQWRPEYERATA
jgi:hemoglobin-like flavoprotein